MNKDQVDRDLIIDDIQVIAYNQSINLFQNSLIDPISPCYSDVDFDGYKDSLEFKDGRLWLEAENYVTTNGTSETDSHASNGRYISSSHSNTMMTITENLLPGKYYIGVSVKKENNGDNGYANLSVYHGRYQNKSIFVEYNRYSIYYLEDIYISGNTEISLKTSNSDILIDRILIIQTRRNVGNVDITLNRNPTNPVIFKDILYCTYPDSLSDPFSRNYDFDWIPDPDQYTSTKYSDEDELGTSETKLYRSDPLDNDKDNDHITDYDELSSDIVTNPWSPDSDRDLIPDGWVDGWSFNKETHAWGICSYFKDGNYNSLGTTYGNYISVEGEIGDHYNGSVDCIGTENIGGNDYITTPLPNNQDTDNDGFIDGYEILYGTDPCDSDTDDDGLGDYYEIRTLWSGDDNIFVTDPENPDSDFDGLTDGLELGFDEGMESFMILDLYYVKGTASSWVEDQNTSSTTDPTYYDSDGDGLPDGWIDGWNFNYTDRNLTLNNVTVSIDHQYEPGEIGIWGRFNDTFDNDTIDLSNGPIYHYPSYPVLYQNINSVARDGLAQPWEGEDRDLDGMVDYTDNGGTYKWNKTQDNTTKDSGEYYETDPNLVSTDGGLASDSLEILSSYSDDYGSINWSRSYNPLDSSDDLTLWSWSNLEDTDGDGLVDILEDFNCNGRFDPNGTEANAETNLYDVDTDDDGLSDGYEVIIGTNPKKYDTDGDGLCDGQELRTTAGLQGFTNGQFTINGTNPYLFRYDCDPNTRTDPLDVDTDDDGLPDGWIDGWGYNPDETGHEDSIAGWGPHYTAYNTLDFDGDGFTNAYEDELGYNVSDPGNHPSGNANRINNSHLDYDGDGFSNRVELLNGTSIYDENSYPDTDYHTKDTAKNCFEDGIQQPWEGEDFNLNGKQDRFLSSTSLEWEYVTYNDFWTKYAVDRDFDGYTNISEEEGGGNDSNPSIQPIYSGYDTPNSLYYRYTLGNDTFFSKECSQMHLGVETSPIEGHDDTNFDGYKDGESILNFSDPYDDDLDDDSLKNIDERLKYHTNQTNPDTDSDGINDNIELSYVYSNWEETNKTDPLVNDTDHDGLLDGWEREYYLSYPGTAGTWLNPCNNNSDSDIYNIEDGMETEDFHEMVNGNPMFINDHVTNLDEQKYNGDPSSNDTDGDGLTDYEELVNGTALDDRDTDGDILWDYEEIKVYLTNPLDVDSDGDGVTDYYEILYGTDPNNASSCDADFDGVYDCYDSLIDKSKRMEFSWSNYWMRGMIEKTFEIKTIYMNNTTPKDSSGRVYKYNYLTGNYFKYANDGAATISYNPGPSFEDVEAAVQDQYNFPSYNITEMTLTEEDDHWTDAPYRTAKGPLYPTTYEIDYEIRDRDYDVTIKNNKNLTNWFEDPYGHKLYSYYYTGDGNGDLLKLSVVEDQSQMYTIQMSLPSNRLYNLLQQDYVFVQPAFKYIIFSPDQDGDYFNCSRYENYAIGSNLNEGSYEFKINIPRDVATSPYIETVNGTKYVNIAICPIYLVEDDNEKMLQFPIDPTRINFIGGIEYTMYGDSTLLIVRNDKDFDDYLDGLLSSQTWNELATLTTGQHTFSVSGQEKNFYNYNPLIDSGSVLSSDTNIDIIVVSGNSEAELMENLFKQGFTKSNWIISGNYNASGNKTEFYQMARNIISAKTNDLFEYSGDIYSAYGENLYIEDIMKLHYNIDSTVSELQPQGLTLPDDDETIYKVSKMYDASSVFYEVNIMKISEEELSDMSSELVNNTKLVNKAVRKYIETCKKLEIANVDTLDTIAGIVGNVEDIYTSGDLAISAYRKGDYVECIFYSLETAGHSVELILSISDISVVKDGIAKYLGKSSESVGNFIKKAGIVIDIVMCAIQIGFEIYNYYQADNNIEKRMCVERMAGHIADLGLGLAAKACPYLLAITITWELTMSFLCKIFPNPLVEKALKKPGQALVFYYEYVYFPVIPGAICELAYEHGVSEMESYRDEWCKNGFPVAILISD